MGDLSLTLTLIAILTLILLTAVFCLAGVCLLFSYHCFTNVNAFTIQHDDVYLLCSDGLYNELSADEMGKHLKVSDLSKVSDKLMQACLSHEARDNVSFIAIKASR